MKPRPWKLSRLDWFQSIHQSHFSRLRLIWVGRDDWFQSEPTEISRLSAWKREKMLRNVEKERQNGQLIYVNAKEPTDSFDWFQSFPSAATDFSRLISVIFFGCRLNQSPHFSRDWSVTHSVRLSFQGLVSNEVMIVSNEASKFSIS